MERGGEAPLLVGAVGGEPVVDKEQLTRLHETYVWYVNAAVGEGRYDLVDQLADEYLDEALALLTEGDTAGCGRPDCVACRPRPVAVSEPEAEPPPVTGWRRWLSRTARR